MILESSRIFIRLIRQLVYTPQIPPRPNVAYRPEMRIDNQQPQMETLRRRRKENNDEQPNQLNHEVPVQQQNTQRRGIIGNFIYVIY